MYRLHSRMPPSISFVSFFYLVQIDAFQRFCLGLLCILSEKSKSVRKVGAGFSRDLMGFLCDVRFAFYWDG